MRFPVQFFAVFGSYYIRLGVAPDPIKVEAIAKLSAPTDVHTLCSILGCCNYYKCFIPRYAHISAPLTDLLCTGAEWLWGQA